MADFIIDSLRGGMNDSDPALSLDNDQSVLAENVEYLDSVLGERRRGAIEIDLTGGPTGDRVTFLQRHLPTADESTAQLWALGVTGTASSVMAYKDTAWHTVSPVDAVTLTGNFSYQLQARTIHGKLFIAYKSGQDRLHVWDGTTLRRVGIINPTNAPTAVDTGVGTFASVRYYRVRAVVVAGSVVLRRSEPSPVLTFTPSGTGLAARVTKPAATGENETHWELEASKDNATFYQIARTVVGTTTYDDSTDYGLGYGGFDLSDTSGDYTLIPSVRFLEVDEDRLLMGGSFENDALASRVTWTPVYSATGSGNDERIPIATTNFVDLDTYEGGSLTDLSGPLAGSMWAFKLNHIYKLVRTGDATRAYDVLPITKSRGALPFSVVEGLDQAGRPCLYFLDPHVGPCRIGSSGLQTCGLDIRKTWARVNINAANTVCRGLYDPMTRQVHWWIAVDDADTPTLRIVLHTHLVRDDTDGARRGFTIWTGPSAAVFAVCLFAENIDDNDARSITLRPFLGVSGGGLIWRTDTGDDDNGTDYTATIVTKPYTPTNILNRFGVTAGAILATAVPDAQINVTLTSDFGLTTKDITSVDFTPVDTETQVIRFLDNLSLNELRVLQVTFEDVPNTARWELNQLCIKELKGQTA